MSRQIVAPVLFLFIFIFIAAAAAAAAATAVAATAANILPPVEPFTPEGRLIEAKPRVAEFLVLDKITARKQRIKINSGEVASFGTLFVRLRHCESSEPEAVMPEAKVFVEVYEKPPGGSGTLHRIFNGWMFASSPSINGLEHAVYDMWPISCKDRSPVR